MAERNLQLEEQLEAVFRQWPIRHAVVLYREDDSLVALCAANGHPVEQALSIELLAIVEEAITTSEARNRMKATAQHAYDKATKQKGTG